MSAASVLAATQALAAGPASDKLLEIKKFKPTWEKYGVTQANAKLLSFIEIDSPTVKTIHLLQGNIPLLQDLLHSLSLHEEAPVLWTLTVLYDILREDASAYNIIENGMKSKIDFYKIMMTVMDAKHALSNLLIVERASWILSAVMGHCPGYFSETQVSTLLTFVIARGAVVPGSDDALWILDVITNLMKSPQFRTPVWSTNGVDEYVFDVKVTAKPAALYKSIFAMWLLSFDDDKIEALKKNDAIGKIKTCLLTSRVEKVVRMCLTVLRNLMSKKHLSEEIVESNMLDAVRALELEKWREEEFYDEILDMVQLIGKQVQEVSNFEKYEKEVNSGKLTWGYIHMPKFFGENIMKFEQNDFRVLQKLKLLLDAGPDPTTLAVACHDIGEFVALHPRGKFVVNKFDMKEKIMQLMACTGENMLEVRREALLCCQKIMLNKWQDVDKAK